MYETPTITELGTIADFTKGRGPGNGADNAFIGWFEDVSGWDISYATS